ncbi:MAG TPA: hypothetical protein ENK55_00430 [Actinobacteria bacterium]|nr:hypothetical protein [Actinomycetota bacterium]
MTGSATPHAELERTEAELAAARTHEEAFAECMREQGFEYVPWIPKDLAEELMAPQGFAPPSGEVDDYSLRLPVAMPPTPREREELLRRAETEGFGIFIRSDITAPADNVEDPNIAIADRLDEESREARERAMKQCELELGEKASGSPESSAGWPDGIDDELVFEAAAIVEGLVVADIAYQEAMIEFRRCMTARGYPVSDPAAAYDLVAGWFEEEDARARAEGRPIEVLTEEGLAAAMGKERLAALQADERAVAMARVECSEPLHRVWWELAREYENQVLADDPRLAALIGP